jgi:hypothetical protein
MDAAILPGLFAFWHRHRDYARLLEKNGMLYMLMSRFHLYLDPTPEFIPLHRSAEEQEYSGSLVAGGLWMMLRTWLLRGFTETPEQLGEIYVKLSSGAVQDTQ